MPLADTLFRRGHLSDQAIVAAWHRGDRSTHLNDCDICLTRLLDLTRWLDDIRDVAVADADAAFPPERLAAQQAQIFRRLEHLDRPARLLAFPGAAKAGAHDSAADRHRRTLSGWPGWIAAGVTGVAAGLVLGVFADRVVNLESARRAEARASVNATINASARSVQDSDEAAMLIGTDVSRPYVSELAALDEAMPSVIRTSASRTGR